MSTCTYVCMLCFPYPSPFASRFCGALPLVWLRRGPPHCCPHWVCEQARLAPSEHAGIPLWLALWPSWQAGLFSDWALTPLSGRTLWWSVYQLSDSPRCHGWAHCACWFCRFPACCSPVSLWRYYVWGWDHGRVDGDYFDQSFHGSLPHERRHSYHSLSELTPFLAFQPNWPRDCSLCHLQTCCVPRRS